MTTHTRHPRTPERAQHWLIMHILTVILTVMALFALLCCCGYSQERNRIAKPAPAELPEATNRPGPRRIVFDSDRSGNYEIYLMKDDGSGVKALTNDRRFDSWWGRVSPDQRRILFYRTPAGVHDRDYSQTSLWLMNADGTAQVELRPAGTDGWQLQGHAEWSPDGQHLVMFGGRRVNPQIYLTKNDGRESRQLTNRGGANLDPGWSPDGRTIVFIGCPSAICFPKNYELYTIPATGSETAQRLTNDALRDHDPYYSPDGKLLAWLTQTSTNGQVGAWNIRLAAADGSGLRYVTNDRNINSKPEWSRDGSLIYFHRLEVGKSKFSIFSIRPDGSNMKEITAGQSGNNEYPSN